jgi:glycosyltransferase involved in cell wall biosynthesis
MKRANVTHVHAHFATHPALAGLIIYRLTGIPFSFTAHGSDLHVERRMLDKKVAAAAFAVTISSYNKALIIQECEEEMGDKIHVIHCGIDPTVFVPRPKHRIDGLFHILCIGSFEEVKGHTYLIEACRILRERGVDFRCHLVGAGPRRRLLETQVKQAALQHHVQFHGGLPRTQVAAMLQSSDVAVLASVPTRSGKREGIPVSLMEAMASGVPVVSSDMASIPELVESGRSGLLVPPRDAAALAAALQTLRDDETLRSQLGQAGRTKILQEFNLYKNVVTLLRLCQQECLHSPILPLNA